MTHLYRKASRQQNHIIRHPNLIMWLMTIGSGGSKRLVRRCGISENFRRGQSKICERRNTKSSWLKYSILALDKNSTMCFYQQCNFKYNIHYRGLSEADSFINYRLWWMLINDSNQAYLLEVLVTVDVLLVMWVLQFIGFDILPEGLDDTGASLCVYSQQTSQTRIQFKLRRLHTEHKALR